MTSSIGYCFTTLKFSDAEFRVTLGTTVTCVVRSWKVVARPAAIPMPAPKSTSVA